MFMMFVLSSMLKSCMLGSILVMLNLVWNLNLQLSIFSNNMFLFITRRKVATNYFLIYNK